MKNLNGRKMIGCIHQCNDLRGMGKDINDYLFAIEWTKSITVNVHLHYADNAPDVFNLKTN